MLFERVEQRAQELERGCNRCTAKAHQAAKELSVALHGTAKQCGCALDHGSGCATYDTHQTRERGAQGHAPTIAQTRIGDLLFVQHCRIVGLCLMRARLEFLDLAMDVFVGLDLEAHLLGIDVVVPSQFHLGGMQARFGLTLDVDINLLVGHPLHGLGDALQCHTGCLEG